MTNLRKADGYYIFIIKLDCILECLDLVLSHTELKRTGFLVNHPNISFWKSLNTVKKYAIENRWWQALPKQI
jgi:hypothetical protein